MQLKYHKILVIDDEIDLTMMMHICLKSHGLAVQVAANGREGLEKAAAFHPDIIFLDIVMPVMDGWEFCRQIQLHPDEVVRETPIIIMTALQPGESNSDFEKSGAIKILTKPFRERDVFYILQNDLKTKKEKKLLIE